VFFVPVSNHFLYVLLPAPQPFHAATLEDSGCGSVWHKQGLVHPMKAAFKTSNTREKSLCPPQKTAHKPIQKQRCTVAGMFTYMRTHIYD